jgi:hypothetical protein
MKVEFRCINVPQHWKVLSHIIEHDSHLPADVRIIVRQQGIEFLLPSGGEIVVAPPEQCRGERLGEIGASRQFLGWLSRVFRQNDGKASPPAYTIREPRDGRRSITPPPQVPRLGRTRFE